MVCAAVKEIIEFKRITRLIVEQLKCGNWLQAPLIICLLVVELLPEGNRVNGIEKTGRSTVRDKLIWNIINKNMSDKHSSSFSHSYSFLSDWLDPNWTV